MPSSVIKGWTYDEADQRLDVTFVSGRRYAYHEVPAEVAAEMKLAFAKGEFFNKRVRGKYRFSELRRADADAAPAPTPARPAG